MKANRSSGLALWSIPALFLVVFFFFPLGEIIARSGILSSFTSLSDSDLLVINKSLTFTIFQAALSTLFTMVIGIPGAYLLARFHFLGRGIFKALLVVPFILPTVVVASSMNALIGPHGFFNGILMAVFHLQSPPLQILNSLWAIILAHVFYNTSIVILIVGEAWSRLNQNHIAAARTLGAGPLTRTLWITLPLLMPAILAAAILVFLFDFTSFGVILLLGGPNFATLEVEIYIQAIHMLNFRMAALLSGIQITITLILSILYSRISRRQTLELMPQFLPVQAISTLNPFLRILVIFGLGSLFFLFITPLLALLIRSIYSFQSGTISLVYFRELFINRQGNLFYIPPYRAILNSIIFAGITLGITLPLGLLTVTALKLPLVINRILEPLLILPLGTSAVTLGLGILLAFSGSALGAHGFPILLPIAHSLVAFPLVIRILQPARDSIPANLIHSARILGASRWQTFWKVEFPILRSSVIIAGIFTFSISLGEFGATTFLVRPGYPTLPIAIYRFLSQPGQMNYGQAMAMSAILMLICLFSILVIQFFSRPTNGQEGRS